MTPKRRILMAPRQQSLESRSIDIEIDVKTELSLVPKASTWARHIDFASTGTAGLSLVPMQDAWSSASDNAAIESRSGNWAERSRSGRN